MCSKCHLLYGVFRQNVHRKKNDSLHMACKCLKYLSTVEDSVVCGPPTKKKYMQCVPSSPECVTSPDPEKKTTSSVSQVSQNLLSDKNHSPTEENPKCANSSVSNSANLSSPVYHQLSPDRKASHKCAIRSAGQVKLSVAEKENHKCANS